MIRIGRLTDYGIVVMTFLAKQGGEARNTSEVALAVGLPDPTVGKVLRRLTREGLLVSQRGAKGGYSLAAAASDISVARIIAALEGPIALTACATADPDCAHEASCPIAGHWIRINSAIRVALESISLEEMASPLRSAVLHAAPRQADTGDARRDAHSQ